MALVLCAILALLIALAARVDAQPFDDEDGAPADETPVSVPTAGEARSSGAAPALIPVSEAELRRVSATAPPVSAVVAAAYRTAGLADDPTRSWSIRSRLAGLVPMVSARVGNNQSWREVPDPTIGHVLAFDVRAMWRLDRLLFEPNELRIKAIATNRRRERRRVAADTIHTYYRWLRAQAAASHEPRWTAHAEEVTAELDALTDGWFSEVLAKAVERQ